MKKLVHRLFSHKQNGTAARLRMSFGGGLLFLIFLDAGCSKLTMPKVENLIHDSAAILVVENKDDGYVIARILKNSPKTLSSFKVGEKAELVRGDQINKARGNEAIVVFFQSKITDPKNGVRLIQTETPIDSEGKLGFYHITVQELVSLIGK